MKRIPSISKIMLATWWLASVTVVLSACSKQEEFEYIDEVLEPEDDVPSVVVTDENGNASTMTPGATIGIYVVGEDGSVTLQQVEVDEDGNAVLPTTAEGGSMIAYSPYQEEWDEDALVTTPTFTVEADQSAMELYEASDLMIGTSGQTTRATAPAMTFSHMLAKVAIHVIDETGRVDLQRINAELLGVLGSVTVDLPNQTVTTLEDDRFNIPMLSEMTTDWRISSYAIVAPQRVVEGAEFYAITLYGSRKTYPIPETTMLEGGKTYTINLRLTDHGLIPDGWYVTDWDDEGERMIDAK